MPKKKKSFLSKITKSTQRNREARENLDEEEKHLQRSQAKERMSQSRAKESEEQKDERLQLDKVRTSKSRESERKPSSLASSVAYNTRSATRKAPDVPSTSKVSVIFIFIIFGHKILF